MKSRYVLTVLGEHQLLLLLGVWVGSKVVSVSRLPSLDLLSLVVRESLWDLGTGNRTLHQLLLLLMRHFIVVVLSVTALVFKACDAGCGYCLAAFTLSKAEELASHAAIVVTIDLINLEKVAIVDSLNTSPC